MWLKLGFGCQVIPCLFSLRDRSHWVYSLISFILFICRRRWCIFAVMGSRATNNSMQTAPVMPSPLTGEDDVANAPSTSHPSGSLEGLPSTSQAVDASGVSGISPVIPSLIAQTVRAALTTERASHLSSSLASTPPVPSVSSPSVPSTAASECLGAFLLCCPAQRTHFFDRWCWSCWAVATR